ncbi:MAG: PAS domain S-box protein [Chitinophagales bacterium]
MFSFIKSIGRKLTQHNLTIIIIIAVLSITFSLYRISEAEKDLSKNIQELSRENEKYSGISEEIYHLDDKLSMSTLMYVYTKDEKWKDQYKYNRNRLTGLLSKELKATSDEFILHSIEELKSSEIKMVALENEAIRLVHRDKMNEALAILNNEEYQAYKSIYASVLDGIRKYLLKEAEENKMVIANGLKHNRLIYFIILITNLLTWLLLVTLFDRSKKQVVAGNIELQRINKVLNKSIALEKNKEAVKDDVPTVMTKYLAFLKENLPFSNYHIIDRKDGKYQLLKSHIGDNNGSLIQPIDFSNDDALCNFLNNVTEENELMGYSESNIYSGSKILKTKKSIKAVGIPIHNDNTGCSLLLLEGGIKHKIKESDIGIIKTISSQLKISLENAHIYTNMEETIEQRTFELKRANLNLLEKEEKLTTAQQIAKLGNWELCSKSMLITVSDEVLDILEIKSDKNTFKPEFFAEFIDASDYIKLVESYKEFINKEDAPQLELKIKSATNQIKYLYIRTAEKKVTNGKVSVFGTIQDITDRKKVELAYKESRERFLNVFENNQTGVVVTDADQRFTMVNSQFVNMLGYSKEELEEMTIFDIANIEQREKSIKSYEKLMTGEIKSFIDQKIYNRKDGNHIHVITKTFGNYDSEGKFIEAVASVLDITQQVESNKKVMESIIETENLERTRIATTLHDSIGQNLTSLHLMLGSIAKSETIGEADLNNVKKAIKIAKDTILETRQISHNLMPKYISRFGLLASIDNLVQDLNATNSGIEFTLYSNFTDDILSISIQIAIYRIIQEAVNNILKYSKAEHVYIQLVKHGNIITVLIDDDGCGFDINTVEHQESLGLKSIKNRANSISAELEIDTMPDRGTTISLQLTLNNEYD